MISFSHGIPLRQYCLPGYRPVRLPSRKSLLTVPVGLHRLGIFYMDLNVQNVNPPPPQTITFTRGMKLCEMRSIRGGQKKIKMFTATTNHPGNVPATISDRKLRHSGDGTTDYYAAYVMPCG